MTSKGPKTQKKKNAYASVKIDPEDKYVTPGAFELERLFWHTPVKFTHVNESFPICGPPALFRWSVERLHNYRKEAAAQFIDPTANPKFEKTALDRYNLEKMGMTHVLNAADGKWNVGTGPEYYSDMTIEYYGVEAEDLPRFDLSQFFYPATQFIDSALSNPKNKLLVHCAMGRSRSATLVLAYLMIYKNMTVVDAINEVIKHRCILPNRGFLKQLRQLDINLLIEKKNAKNDVNSNGEQNGEKEDTVHLTNCNHVGD